MSERIRCGRSGCEACATRPAQDKEKRTKANVSSCKACWVARPEAPCRNRKASYLRGAPRARGRTLSQLLPRRICSPLAHTPSTHIPRPSHPPTYPPPWQCPATYLDVPMKHPPRVAVVHRRDELPKVAAAKALAQPARRADELKKVPPARQLHHQVHLGLGHHHLGEGDNVGVAQRAEDAHLAADVHVHRQVVLEHPLLHHLHRVLLAGPLVAAQLDHPIVAFAEGGG